MTKYIKCGGGGLPPQVITDMNAVLNKKFGTSTTYPSSEWADKIEEMTALPEESASGSIAHFTDGADTVPLKSCTLTLAPTQTGTGDPSPTNPRPITGVSSVNVTSAGANFFDDSVYSDYEQADGSFSGLGSDFNSLYFYIPQDLVGVEVTFSAYIKIPTGSTITNPRVSVRVNNVNTNGNAVTSNDYSLSSITFTPTSTSDRVRITYGSNGSQPVQFKEPQLEVGAVVTPFVEYSAPTLAPVSLGQTVYGGEVDVAGGEVTETTGYKLFTGAEGENWQNYAAGNGYYIQISDMASLNNGNGLYNLFPAYSGVNNLGVRLGFNNNVLYVYQANTIDGVSDVATWKTWLSTHNLQACYPLATPTTAQITPTEINSRYGVNNLWHDGNGDTAVEYRADIDLYVAEHS